MAILSYGKPLIELAPVDIDGNIGRWFAIDTPKENTSNLETSAGDKTEYIEEGGGLVDSYQKKSKYTLKFELFGKKGKTKPIKDNNGVITQNYAARITPEDPSTLGLFMPRCSASCDETWSTQDGILWKYSFDGLLSPDYEEIYDNFTPTELLRTSDNYVAFSATEEEDKEVTCEVGAGATLSITKEEDMSWVTASAEGGKVTISVSANTTGEKRVGWLTITDGQRTAELKVIQSASK